MANLNAPNGFSPVKLLAASGFNFAINSYYIPSTDSTAVGIGDVVKLASGSTYDAISGQYLKNVAKVATPATDVPVGVVVGFAFDPNNLMNKYRVASTNRIVFVADAPEQLFEAQSDATGIAVADIGKNATFTTGTVNTTTGVTDAVVTGPATTNTLPFEIVGFSSVTKNEVGAYSRVILRWNKHQYATAQTTGV